MTDKAYIVANEQQEREVLRELEQAGHTWTSGTKPTDWVPSKNILGLVQFPYALLDMGYVAWRVLTQLIDEKIAFDGRKEERMSEKYVVSQEFMGGLNAWKGTLYSNDDEYKPFVGIERLENLPEVVFEWLESDEVADEENNNRLIAIIRWVNGEDVFEVEKPKKWVVRSDKPDEIGSYWYVLLHVGTVDGRAFDSKGATKFDTKEEAESWANAHQEVVEVEE